MNGTTHSPNGFHENGYVNNNKLRLSEARMSDSKTIDRIQTKSPPPFKQNISANHTDERRKMGEHRKKLPIYEGNF